MIDTSSACPLILFDVVLFYFLHVRLWFIIKIQVPTAKLHISGSSQIWNNEKGYRLYNLNKLKMLLGTEDTAFNLVWVLQVGQFQNNQEGFE